MTERYDASHQQDHAQSLIEQYRKFISATPTLVSLLYDADMMPEQIVSVRGATSLAAVVIAYQEGVKAVVIQAKGPCADGV